MIDSNQTGSPLPFFLKDDSFKRRSKKLWHRRQKATIQTNQKEQNKFNKKNVGRRERLFNFAESDFVNNNNKKEDYEGSCNDTEEKTSGIETGKTQRVSRERRAEELRG